MNSTKLSDILVKWESFKIEFPHMNEPFSKRNWGSDLHSVCSYQGKMKPALAYHLIDTFSSEGDTVLDPFSGSGTIPFEAAINGRYSFGLDIGLLATSVSNAKLKRHNPTEVFKIIDMLSDFISNNTPEEKSISESKEVAFNKTIPEYFHEDTFREILLAREFFLKYKEPESENWSLVFSCMLHILHGNRPYALSRNSHPITPYAPTGDFIYKNVVEKLTNKVKKSIEAQELLDLAPAKCFLADILHEWPLEIQKVDAIITSPPFFDSTKFYMTNWMRYWFCGWNKQNFQENPKSFIEVMQKKNFDVYDFIFKQSYERLVDNGVAVFHLGHSDKCDMAESLKSYAEKYFKVEDIFTESVEHCEKHGIKDKGGVKGHQYLVLSKK
ncbi:SAM-dependent methyltransferase [Acinetobacter sp. ANC 4779]|uniref:DNA methyltransferase n=1 Tax=Acinetobacter sp. ANC 4779 TaxID=2529848 RepID=UPI00103EA3D6|nr:DNA methyltransferase [Acinetobacter sp. ANC 4779]TCB47719.1 SAM-dependent methyltransferase [Acinetobacter sp. ANC 4779]